MNRTIALFLALVVLLAHTLAIYASPTGTLAPPYDFAHVAFRMARNLVQNGVFAWNPDLPPGESYPSLVWIGVAAFAERCYLTVTTFCQVVGIATSLLAVLVISKFSPLRLAGVIAPLLLVVSGPMAAAAGSGTEMTTAALFIAIAFLAQEHAHPLIFAASMVLVALIRAEGALLIGVFLAFELVRGWRGGFVRERFLPFLAPVIAFTGTALVRKLSIGTWTSPAGDELFEYDTERVKLGLWYLRDFLVAGGGPILIVVPLWYALRGVLDAVGVRALVLSLAWCAMIAWMGGGPLPFFARMVPILPVWFVAVQEGMTIALDSKRRGWPEFAWTAFLLGLAVSALASKYPGDLGPFRVEALHRRWMQPHTAGPFGYSRPLGRLGLAEELAATERLRALGVFLRDQVDANESVLTAWPGAAGYLSRLEILDVLGRATPPPPDGELRSWSSLPRADVIAALDQRPSYIVPLLHAGTRAPTMRSVGETWIKRLDFRPEDESRSLAILERLGEYELFTISLRHSSRLAGAPVDDPMYLLRRKDLNLAPRVMLSKHGERWRVEVQHRAHEELVDLRVQAVDREQHVWGLAPHGHFSRDSEVLARRSILLFATGARAIQFVEFELPDDAEFTELRAALRNPGAESEGPWAYASREVRAQL
ncbi:MAG: hypothetical protein L6Q99_02120 [Planctomycetes bacterium]|nr:hypothetical protein [Planctomycetota bacterium]